MEKLKPDLCFEFGQSSDDFLLEQIRKGQITKEEKGWRGKFLLTPTTEYYPNKEKVKRLGKERE